MITPQIRNTWWSLVPGSVDWTHNRAITAANTATNTLISTAGARVFGLSAVTTSDLRESGTAAPEGRIVRDEAHETHAQNSMGNYLLSLLSTQRVGAQVLLMVFEHVRSWIGSTVQTTDSRERARFNDFIEGTKRKLEQHIQGERGAPTLLEITRDAYAQIRGFNFLFCGILQLNPSESSSAPSALSFELGAMSVGLKETENSKRTTYKDHFEETQKQIKRLERNICYFSIWKAVESSLGTPPSEKDIRTKITENNVDKSNEEVERLIKEALQKRNPVFFNSIMENLLAEERANPHFDMDKAFLREIEKYIDSRKDANRMKRWGIKITLPTLFGAVKSFTKRSTSELVGLVRRQVAKMSSEFPNPKIFTHLHQICAKIKMIWEGYAKKDSIGKNGFEADPIAYLRSAADKLDPVPFKKAHDFITNYIPSVGFTKTVKKANNAMVAWVNNQSNNFVKALMWITIALPFFLIWLFNNLLVFPIEKLTDVIIRSIVKRILDKTNLIQEVLRKEKTAEETSKFTLAMEKVLHAKVEALYKKIVVDKKPKGISGLARVPEGQRPLVERAVRGFATSIFEVAEMSQASTADEMRALCSSDQPSSTLAHLNETVKGSIRQLEIPGTVNSLVDIVYAIMDIIRDRRSLEKHLGLVVTALNDTIEEHGKPIDASALEERNRIAHTLRTNRESLLRQVTHSSVGGSVENTAKKFGLIESEASQDYVFFLQRELIGDCYAPSALPSRSEEDGRSAASPSSLEDGAAFQEEDGGGSAASSGGVQSPPVLRRSAAGTPSLSEPREGSILYKIDKDLDEVIGTDDSVNLDRLHEVTNTTSKFLEKWRIRQEQFEEKGRTIANEPAMQKLVQSFGNFQKYLVPLRSACYYQKLANEGIELGQLIGEVNDAIEEITAALELDNQTTMDTFREKQETLKEFIERLDQMNIRSEKMNDLYGELVAVEESLKQALEANETQDLQEAVESLRQANDRLNEEFQELQQEGVVRRLVGVCKELLGIQEEDRTDHIEEEDGANREESWTPNHIFLQVKHLKPLQYVDFNIVPKDKILKFLTEVFHKHVNGKIHRVVEFLKDPTIAGMFSEDIFFGLLFGKRPRVFPVRSIKV